jgi:hypothetical protein
VSVIGALVEAEPGAPHVTVRTERDELRQYLEALPSSFDHFGG